MATYINTNVLLKSQEVFESGAVNEEDAKKKYAWLLLGTPTKNVALGEGEEGEEEAEDETKSYYPLETEWKIEGGKITFKNANVCGVAPVDNVPNYSLVGADSDEVDFAESIVYNFPGNSNREEGLLYPMAPNVDSEEIESVSKTEGFSLDNGYLAFVKLVKTYTTYDELKNYYASLWTTGEPFSQMSKEKAVGSEIASSVKVLVAYDVANQTMVNQYNFTGFNVGASSLTINGLISNN